MIKNKKTIFMILLSLCTFKLFSLDAFSMNDGVLDSRWFRTVVSEDFVNYSEMDMSGCDYSPSNQSQKQPESPGIVDSAKGVAINTAKGVVGEMYQSGTQYLLSQGIGKAASTAGAIVSAVGRPLGLAALGSPMISLGNNASSISAPLWTQGGLNGVKNLCAETAYTAVLGAVAQKVVPEKLQKFHYKLQKWIDNKSKQFLGTNVPGHLVNSVVSAMYSTGTKYAVGQAALGIAKQYGLISTVNTAVNGMKKSGYYKTAAVVNFITKVIGGVATNAAKPAWLSGKAGFEAFSKQTLKEAVLNLFIDKIEKMVPGEMQDLVAIVN